MLKQSRWIIILLLLTPLLMGFQSWQRPPAQPPQSFNLQALSEHPLDSQKALVVSQNQLYEQSSSGDWIRLLPLNTQDRVHQLFLSENLPSQFFLLKNHEVIQVDLTSHSGKALRLSSAIKKHRVLSFSELTQDPDHLFLGTSQGLFESDDRGKNWLPFEHFKNEVISILQFSHNRLFIGAGNQLIASSDLQSFKTLFRLPATQNEFSEESEDDNLSYVSNFDSPINDLVITTGHLPTLWLATDQGVFESKDEGTSWRSVSTSGLRNRQIKHLIFAEPSGPLFAGAHQGIYQFDFKKNIWKELFQGLDNTQPLDLALIPGPPAKLIALTKSGLLEYFILPDQVVTQAVWNPQRHDTASFKKLLGLEPTAWEVHSQVVRDADLSNQKIKRWHAASRLRALVPSFSLGKDFSESNNVDLDRGSTNTPDKYIFGPSNLNKGWDWDVSWDLGDFVWSSSQTSIDNRSKLMVDLRHEFLAEATRIYYERRRLQMEILFSPAEEEQLHFERLIRMDELSSLLDGMTGGWFTQRLSDLYAEHPEFNELWGFHDQASTAHTQH